MLRPRPEAEGAAQGTREYIRVLRLLETHSLRDLEIDRSESSCRSPRSQAAMAGKTLGASWLAALLLVV